MILCPAPCHARAWGARTAISTRNATAPNRRMGDIAGISRVEGLADRSTMIHGARVDGKPLTKTSQSRRVVFDRPRSDGRPGASRRTPKFPSPEPHVHQIFMARL